MKNLILIAAAAISLAACAGPTLNGQSDAAMSAPHMAMPTGPYDNTANSLGGRYIAGGGGN
jgi:hypothetical protein